MFKWVSWVIRMGATALLLSFLCIWTTGYIVNSYMETVIKQLDLPIEMQPFALTGVWGKLWGAEKPSQAKQQVNEEKKPEASSSASPLSSKETMDNPINGAVISGEQDQNAAENPQSSIKPEEEASPSPDDGNVDTIPVFIGEAESQQLTDAQRQSLYAMVVSKLNQEQLKQLSNALQGGLTGEELSEMQGMLKSALTEQEYAQMMALLSGDQQTNSEAPAE
jgi:hypothetical protein